MLNLNPPLDDYFLEIIKSYAIEDWEAKYFWSIIRELSHQTQANPKALKQDMYTAIKMLTKNGYLYSKKSPFNKNTYLYSESEKIKELRKQLIEAEEKNPLIVKKNDILKELDMLKKEIKFLSELILSCPEFNDHIKEYGQEVEHQIDYCTVKIRTIDNILNKKLF